MTNQDVWNWNQRENDSVVLPSMRAIAVYTNPAGDIVVRQEDPLEGRDQIVVIPRKMADAVAKAIRAESKLVFDPE